MQIGSSYQNYGAYQVGAATGPYAPDQGQDTAATSSYDGGYYDGYDLDFSPEAAAELGGS